MSDMDNTSPAPEGAGTPNPTSKMARRRARELGETVILRAAQTAGA